MYVNHWKTFARNRYFGLDIDDFVVVSTEALAAIATCQLCTKMYHNDTTGEEFHIVRRYTEKGRGYEIKI